MVCLSTLTIASDLTLRFAGRNPTIGLVDPRLQTVAFAKLVGIGLSGKDLPRPGQMLLRCGQQRRIGQHGMTGECQVGQVPFGFRPVEWGGKEFRSSAQTPQGC